MVLSLQRLRPWATLASGALVAGVVALSAPEVQAQITLEPQQKVKSDLGWPEWLGYAVDAHRGSVIVSGINGSRALLLEHDGVNWEQTHTFIPDTYALGFGSAVTIEENVVVVGASLDDERREGEGSVLVWEKQQSQWSPTYKLQPADPKKNAEFGFAADMDRNWLVVGAPGDGGPHKRPGRAYVFKKTASMWQQVARLDAPNSVDGDRFGSSVAIEGDHLIIGAPSDDRHFINGGAAFIYRFDGTTWNEEGTLGSSVASPDSRFGQAVSIEDDVAVVGAPNENEAHVYRFENGSWNYDQRLQPFSGEPEREFGLAVDLDGDSVVVTSMTLVTLGHASVYRFDGDRFEEEKLFYTEFWSRMFGAAMVAEDGVVHVGAFCDDEAGAEAGALFIFGDLCLGPPGDWNVGEGDDLDFAVEGGAPGAPGIVFARIVGSQWMPIQRSRFDSAGTFDIQATVPPGLEGYDIQLQAMGTEPSGDLRATNGVLLRVR